jgi:hypothetical protein
MFGMKCINARIQALLFKQAVCMLTWGAVLVCREVKSVIGRGKGIPHALRAFARVLCATSTHGEYSYNCWHWLVCIDFLNRCWEGNGWHLLFVCAELTELGAEAGRHDGRLARRPLKSCSKETQAMNLLLARFESLIHQHSIAVCDLNPFLLCCHKLNPSWTKYRLDCFLLSIFHAPCCSCLKNLMIWLLIRVGFVLLCET